MPGIWGAGKPSAARLASLRERAGPPRAACIPRTPGAIESNAVVVPGLPVGDPTAASGGGGGGGGRGVAAAAPCGMRQRAAQAWERANSSLSKDWHYNADFERCPPSLFLSILRKAAQRCSPSALACACVALECGPAITLNDRLNVCRLFWSLTLAIYTIFTAKTAPHMSLQENIENVAIYLGVIGMTVISM